MRICRAVAVRPLAWLTLLLLGVHVGLAPVAAADGGDFSLDFAAAAPGTYSHATGLGGEYDGGGPPGVVNSLSGSDFACNDRVELFTAVTVDPGAVGTQNIEIDFSFATQPSGQPGAGFRDLVSASPNGGDSGMSTNGNEAVTIVSETSDGTVDATIGITSLEASEVFILRLVLLLACDPGENPTGTIQSRMVAARVVFPAPDPIPGGVQTIPLRGAGQIEPAPTPAPSGSGIGGGPLPNTGFPVAWLVVLALGMMLAGLGLGHAARRRG